MSFFFVLSFFVWGGSLSNPNGATFAERNYQSESTVNESGRESISSAVDYLFAEQQKDGRWRSTYYGNLREGAAITALTLFSLSHCDSKTLNKHQESIEKAFHFLKIGIKKNGYVSNPGGPDYATYATAMTLLANQQFKRKLDHDFLSEGEVATLRKFLCNAQLDETHGLEPDDPNYGGWDLSGWMQGKRASAGTNISVSSFALQALEKDASEAAKEARRRARKWLSRLRNSDGGFHFHPEKMHPGNKAAWADSDQAKPRSYGTTGADAIRILATLDPEKLKADPVLKWFENQPFSQKVPGFDATEPDDKNIGNWSQGLYYYYCMSLALELDHLPKKTRRQFVTEARKKLTKTQRKDGSWSNPYTRMREDDPAITTPFALITLLRIGELERKSKNDHD